MKRSIVKEQPVIPIHHMHDAGGGNDTGSLTGRAQVRLGARNGRRVRHKVIPLPYHFDIGDVVDMVEVCIVIQCADQF